MLLADTSGSGKVLLEFLVAVSIIVCFCNIEFSYITEGANALRYYLMNQFQSIFGKCFRRALSHC